MEFGNYKIEADELNVTVSKKMVAKKGEKAGEVYWAPVGYFANMTNALKFLVDLEVKLTGLKDFETVISKQAELYKMIEELKL